MALTAKATLNTNATTVTNETTPNLNNEARIGGLFTNIIDSYIHETVSATDRLLGRDTAGAGSHEEITVGGGVEFTGSGGIQHSAHTGDVTSSAGNAAMTIANGAVTKAKSENVATATIRGRATAGTGVPEDLTVTQVKTLLVPTITTEATTARTLVLGDADTYIRCTSGSATSVTVPPNSSVAFVIGTTVLVRQAGAGLLTLVAGGGVTLSGSSLISSGQHSTLSITKVATDTWDVAGKTA